MSSKDIIRHKMSELSLECYATPVNTDDTFVLLARIKADTSPHFKNVEARLIYFVERALQLAEEPTYKEGDAIRLRFSRLWLLKDGDLRYTWDFTFKGDLDKAAALVGSIKVPSLTRTRVEEVNTQTVAPGKGQVRPVRIGSI
jgi:hypothetical protein